MSSLCPCASGQPYDICCYPYHSGREFPKTSLELMRSRYSGYAKRLPGYIIQTTHKKNPEYKQDQLQWIIDIETFCDETKFTGLDILEFSDLGQEGSVTFVAHLLQGGQDCSFKEQSDFVKEDDRWYYLGGRCEQLSS